MAERFSRAPSHPGEDVLASEAALRGYILEEALAWLLRHTGYRLLVHESQDRAELKQEGNGLQVKGRGADHQVDVLGEFAFPPAFSLPIRLFLEAKFTGKKADLKTVRNAHGVIHDINENFMRGPNSQFGKRYRYVYALFSASGFTPDAESYALAQQISLVDLSSAAFSWLRAAVETAAHELFPLQTNYDVGTFPVNWMRGQLRVVLGTLPDPEPADFSLPETDAHRFAERATPILLNFAEQVMEDASAEFLLGFPSAPFILPILARNVRGFLRFAHEYPSHSIRLRRSRSGSRSEWQVTPSPAIEDTDVLVPVTGQEYLLKFNLPERFEEWIDEREDRRDRRTLDKARKFLSNIVIYRMEMNSDLLETFQLRYDPNDMKVPRLDDPWSAYTDAVVRLETPRGKVWVRPEPPGQTFGKYPDPGGRMICIITAHNPHGNMVSDETNRRAQERLERELNRRGWTWWPAAGGDPEWQHVEASAAVVGVEESEVVALGAEFGQDAIFVLTPASRRVVGCLRADEISTGWSTSDMRTRDERR